MKRRKKGEPSLQERILRFLSSRPGQKVSIGEIERLAHGKGYLGSTASRRCRILEEASRGYETTPEHLRAKKLLDGGRVMVEEIEGSDWYWYEASGTPKPRKEFKRMTLPDGTEVMREVVTTS